jgi:Brp/Blh family beta-carotene 15,15'-monooxygenase
MVNVIHLDWFISGSSVVAIALILLIGIPHGANDHLLFFNLFKKRNPEKGGRNALFFLYYIGLIFLYVGSWFLFPTFSLGLFILMSIYHFGQSNLYHTPFKANPVKLISILFSGAFVILTPIFAHIETATPIIEILSKKSLPIISEDLGTKLALYLLVIVLLYWFSILLLKLIPLNIGLAEMINVLLLFGLFYFCPLWLGFAIYFTLWHAIPSVEDQISFFKKSHSSYHVGKYIREIVPFSVVAISGLILAFEFSENFISVNQAIALLFSFIAVITLPHTIMMELLYQGIESENNDKNTNR